MFRKMIRVQYLSDMLHHKDWIEKRFHLTALDIAKASGTTAKMLSVEYKTNENVYPVRHWAEAVYEFN